MLSCPWLSRVAVSTSVASIPAPGATFKVAPARFRRVPEPRRSTNRFAGCQLNVAPDWSLIVAELRARLPLVHVAGPALFQIREFSALSPPVRNEVLFVVNVFAPVPEIVPPDQLNAPFTVTFPAPCNVPPVSVRSLFRVEAAARSRLPPPSVR